jgi:hypothetical protein
MNVTQLFAGMNQFDSNSCWQVDGADSSRFSPLSRGASNQIEVALGNIPKSDYSPIPGTTALLTAFLGGTDGSSALIMDCPYVAVRTIWQTPAWWAPSANDHYTIDEMNDPWTTFIGEGQFSYKYDPRTNVGSYPPPKIFSFTANASNYAFTFVGDIGQRYGVWCSSDLVHWFFAGDTTPTSPTTGRSYTFTAPFDSNTPTRFFQVRKL